MKEHTEDREQKPSPAGSSLAVDDQFILERNRIYSLLEKAIRNPVILVTAGEGYGKTRAVYSFLRRNYKTAVWVTLSERDNDPWRFWENISKAAGRQNPRAGKALAEIGFPESPGQIGRLFSVLEETVSDNKKHIIVADDCHLIHEETILRFFLRLLTYPFPLRSFILISRAEPGLNTMPLLSKGILSRITADDLRFSREETGEYFKLRNISLSPEEQNDIFTDTEGWALAIGFIAGEMQRENKKYSRTLLEKGSFRRMEDALFASIPASLQRFLVILSLFEQWPMEALEKIAASLPEKPVPTEELTGNMKHLSSLVHYDAFLHGFRIHRIFLDYLREKQTELSGDEVSNACNISAEWCLENNLRIDAAINYGMAGNYGGLIKAIYSFPRLLSRPAAAAIMEILDRVFSDARRDETDANYLFLRHVTRAGMLVNLGRYAESRAEIYESIRKFEVLPPDQDNCRILASCYNTLAASSIITYRATRDAAQSLRCFKRAEYYYQLNPFPVSGHAARVNVGSYANVIGHPPLEGEFEAFINTTAECIPYASRSMGGYLSGVDSLCRAELAFFKGDLGNAERHAREAVFKARRKSQYETESKGLFYLLRIHLCNGDTAASRETWEQMEAQLDYPDYNTRYVIYDIMAGWFYAHTGNMEQIAPWLRNEYEESDLNLNVHNFETMVKAKSLFAEKRYRETVDFLRRKDVREGLGSFHLGILEITALEAVALNRLGDEDGALAALEAAHEMSVSNSLVLPFIELGEEMRTLAGTALNREPCTIPRQWLETIRNLASLYEKKLTNAIEQHRGGQGEGKAPFLTAQEAAILAGISMGYTREEIAANSSISINTVKNIIKTIYDKLGAFNRADAIKIATNFGLLKKT